jgi:hypothetical protein
VLKRRGCDHIGAVVIAAVIAIAASRPAAGQVADSAAVTAVLTAPAAAPAVQRWGDSVSLRTFGLSLRLPADGVRWREQADRQSTSGAYDLVGEVNGVRERVTLKAWNDAEGATCEAWIAVMRGRFERYRRLGMRVPEERVLESPAWLPQGDGWSPTVWNGNACRDGVRRALVVTVYIPDQPDPRAVEATRTMLWYLGAAAARAQR